MVKPKRAARAKSATSKEKTSGAVLPVYEPEKPLAAAAPQWARKLNGTVILGSLLFNVAVSVVAAILTHFLTLDFFTVIYNTMVAWAATSTLTVAYFLRPSMKTSGVDNNTVTLVLLTMLIFIYYIVWSVLRLPVFSS